MRIPSKAAGYSDRKAVTIGLMIGTGAGV